MIKLIYGQDGEIAEVQLDGQVNYVERISKRYMNGRIIESELETARHVNVEPEELPISEA